MTNEPIYIPRISTLGLFDLKLKYGTISATPRRLVHSYEIELPTYNGGRSHINDNTYPIKDDTIICAKPGQWRRTEAPFSCYYLHIVPDNGYVCKALSKLPDTIPVKNSGKYLTIFNDIISAYDRDAHTVNLSVYGKFLILIDMLENDASYAQSPFGSFTKANVKAVERAIDYIDENYMNKITLEQLAQEVFLSPIYLRKLFYDTIGVTPYNYILDKRIEKTKQLLATTDIPISDIAHSCGFSDQAYLGKVFKSVCGVTPLSFRKSINELYP